MCFHVYIHQRFRSILVSFVRGIVRKITPLHSTLPPPLFFDPPPLICSSLLFYILFLPTLSWPFYSLFAPFLLQFNTFYRVVLSTMLWWKLMPLALELLGSYFISVFNNESSTNRNYAWQSIGSHYLYLPLSLLSIISNCNNERGPCSIRLVCHIRLVYRFSHSL